MPEPSNLNADIATKVLEANIRNIVEKVKAGGTLNAAERAIMESAATPKTETPLQEAEAAAAAAPFLFSEAEIGYEKLEAAGEFTGERLLERRPDAYRAVIRMAAEGLSISATARALGVSRNTVAAVREREGICIEQEKKELLRDVRRAARLSVERAIELIPSLNNAKDAAIVAAVMVDKGQLLSGEATSRIERVEVQEDKLREMLAALPVLEAEIVQTGFNPEAPNPKEAPVPPALQPVETHSQIATSGNYQRLTEDDADQSCKPLENNESALPTIGVIGSYRPDSTEPIETGVGGGENFEGGVSDSTYQGPQKILHKGPPPSTPPAAP
jgi:hypothetical protein